MTNVFETLDIYGGEYQVDERRNFTEAEKALISSAKVVPSSYGLSVCFFLKSGGQSYIPVSRDSSVFPGDVVNLETAELLTLSKNGEDVINRVSL